MVLSMMLFSAGMKGSFKHYLISFCLWNHFSKGCPVMDFIYRNIFNFLITRI